MRKKIFNILRFLIIFIVLFISGYFIKIMTDLDIIPAKYYWGIIILLIILNIIGIVGLCMKKIWTKAISILVYAFVSILSIIGIVYGNETLKFLNKSFNNNHLEVTKYDIVVLKDSKYQKIEDLEEKSMGYLKTDTQSSKFLAIVKTKVSVELSGYDDVYDLYDDLIDKKIESIVIDEAYLDMLEDVYIDLDDKIKVISSFDIESSITKEKKIENLSKEESDALKKAKSESINIYISGSDSRSGKITDKSRSDVNMIMTINPKTKTILLTSIPRDYYVQLHGTTGYKDKLTHSGVYGINMSKQTVADLFDIEIDYSIKIGFKSVINLVDLVGGIDIESDTAFTSHCGDGGAQRVKVKKGMNHFNGAEALSYARERYAYAEGDRHRIQNQQQVLEAVIEKVVISKSLLIKYEEFLDSFSELYRTDIPDTLIKAYIKNQLKDMSAWKIEKQWVDGKSASKQTYTMPGRNLYVMVPDEDSVSSAKKKIETVIKGE